MGKRTEYAAGTFCWIDLAATDVAGLAQFYSAVFNWDFDKDDFAGGTYYTARVNGSAVAGMYSYEHPSAWLSYVSVADVDQAAARAEELGATIISPPSEVQTLGRMAIIQDPGEALLALWEGNEMAGAETVNEPGALCLTQLNAQDTEASRTFYEGLFGWEFEREPTDYWGINVSGRLNAGMMRNPDSGADHWIVYFHTESIRDTNARIKEAGGTVIVPIMPIVSGAIAVAQDPAGNTFALFEGRVDD